MLHSGTTAASLQKIYEEGYLKCSTAVYYEGQGNEEEAMRCWRSAVAQIQRQFSSASLPEHVALTESEKALTNSLRELEYQAKERIDLLEALRISREEDASLQRSASDHCSAYPAVYASGSRSTPSAAAAAGNGYIGGGTIPAITYSELSRPTQPPPVPPRPSLRHSRTASHERSVSATGLPKSYSIFSNSLSSNGNHHSHSHSHRNSHSHSHGHSNTPGHRNTPGNGNETGDRRDSSLSGGRRDSSLSGVLIPGLDPPEPITPAREQNTLKKRSSRSPVREKQHTLKSTLRTGTPGESHSKSSRSSGSKKTAERMGASKAATLAWSALGLTSSSSKGDGGRKSKTDLALAKNAVPSLPPPTRKQRDDSPGSLQPQLQWDSNSRRLVPHRASADSMPDIASRSSMDAASLTPTSTPNEVRRSGEYLTPSRPSSLSLNAAASALGRSLQSPSEGARAHRSPPRRRPLPVNSSLSAMSIDRGSSAPHLDSGPSSGKPKSAASGSGPGASGATRVVTLGIPSNSGSSSNSILAATRAELRRNGHSGNAIGARGSSSSPPQPPAPRRRGRGKERAAMGATSEVSHLFADVQLEPSSGEESSDKAEHGEKAAAAAVAAAAEEDSNSQMNWKKRKQGILKNLPPNVDPDAAKQILNEIIVQGDVVHWSDIAGLEPAKKALREAVVYPFLRPDLFMGLREPATGMLLFGPPGTGKTMLARAVATESHSTFFSISASSLTSKYLGESEKLVRALFVLAKTLAPSIIFVDEIDSILSQRSGSGEHEASRRIKTEFLIQWSDLQRAAAGREDDKETTAGSSSSKVRGDATRVLVLAATNLPWAIDEAARRRFVRRQYIPLPEAETRAVQLRTLLGQQKHSLSEQDIQTLVELTDGFSGSDITALAKDAAMGPLRSLGEALLLTKMDEIRPIEVGDFLASLETIRPSVSKAGLKDHEQWAREFGERGG